MDPRMQREAITQYFTNKPSNKERIGCPERAILVRIGRGQLDPADAWYNHLTACPECFQEAELIRAQAAKRRRWGWTIGTAAIAASVIGAVFLWRPMPLPTHEDIATTQKKSTTAPAPAPTKAQEPARIVETAPKEPSKRSVAVLATVDLRGFGIIRGDQGSTGGLPHIRPIEQRLRLILPVASEPGPYRIRLLNTDLITVREATGTALINNGRTLLTLLLDASVTPGDYTLGLQHEGGEWRLYPLKISE